MNERPMKDRVSALLARANDPASSEAEAATCMDKAMQIMTKFGFTMDDVMGDNAEVIGQSEGAWMSGRHGGAMIYVQGAIAAFTSTRVSFRGNVSTGSSATYHGYSAERELATWLHNHIANSIKVESAKYDPGPYPASVRSRDRKSFAIYMAKRISQRLRAMTKDLDDGARATGNEVMIVKNRKLDEHFAGLDLSTYRERKNKLYRDGAQAGMAAGDGVSLHRPVSEAGRTLQITSQ
ncbi:MAG: DUF2786 domain-containing protein [Pseudomonadota bacterium]